MKHLPNLLTALRIVISLALPLCMSYRTLFLILYLICGLTDALDGFFARRFHCQSKLGAVLDSVADALMFAAVVWALIVWTGGIAPVVLAAVLAVAAIRIAAMTVARVRFGRFAILHTVGNKLTGGLLFLYPVEYLLFSTSFLLWPLLVFAFLSAAEELVIQTRATGLDLDRKGLLFK